MAKENEKWEINIENFGGFCPAWFDNTYPFYGNKNQAASMIDADVTDPNFITQGPGVVALTSGDESGELGENLIIAILKQVISSNATYACSTDKVFKLTATAVTNGNFPKTIAIGTANVATDLLAYQGKVLVLWNDTGVDGDIGLLTNDTTWDDDWGSTVATGAAQLEDAPHYGITGGDDVAYITNGKYIATVDGTTLSDQALDFHSDAETISVSWNNNRVIIAVNRPNVTGSNFNASAIYKWNGVSPSWEGDPVEVNGEIGALYTKNGVTFVWWKDSTDTGGYSLGFISGIDLKTIRRYSGSLPNQAQVGEYKGHIAWLSSNKLMLWGSKDVDTPASISQYLSPKDTTVGAFAAPFGTLLISSKKNADFTAATATEIITSAAHGLSDNDTVFLTTTNTLPAGLSLATLYYVITATTNTLQFSASQGGAAVNITDTGTGTHTWSRYTIAKASGYTTTARFNTIAFNVSKSELKSQIDLIMVRTKQMATGAKVDFTLSYDDAKSTKSLTQIAYATTNKTRHKILQTGPQVEDFRIDISWENGSITNPVKIVSIMIRGHYILDN